MYFSLRFKFPYPFQWGAPTFAAGHSFAMMSAVLVSMIEVLLLSFVLSLKFHDGKVFFENLRI